MENSLAQTPVLRFATDFEPRPKLVPSSAQKFISQTQQGSQSQQYQELRVLDFSPQYGQEGATFTATLHFAPPEKQLKLGFGSLVVETKQLNTQGCTTLTTSVPNFAFTKSCTTKVPLNVLVLENDTVVDRWYFGEFSYYEASSKNERKRGSSSYSPSETTHGASLKRIHTSAHNIRTKEEESYINPTNYQQMYQQTSSANSYAGSITEAEQAQAQAQARAAQVQSHAQQQQQQQYQAQSAQALHMHPREFYSEGDDVATTRSAQVIPPAGAYNCRQQPPLSSAYGYGAASSTNSTGLSGMSLGNLASGEMSPPPMTSPSGSAINYLVQTSPPAPTLPGYLAPSSMVGGYSPYPSLLNKANLKITGNMEDMAAGWNTEEWENRRRLVQFGRRQEGNDIHCTFTPVAPADRVPNSIVVSCIYWQEKNDCYITSVDCIYLLESLIGVRFTVEEKNRIRRNLEGFRPQTVSKCKPDSAEFFKLIMGFPNPKPRNIEKDVKVFPWKVLSHALRKIISKYTASYSSTASVNLDSLNTTPYSAGQNTVASAPSVSSPYGYDTTNVVQTSIGPHAPPSSLALEPSTMSQPQQSRSSQSSGVRYDNNTPSPHHIVASQTVRSSSTSPIQSRSPYTQATLQQSHFDAVASQHLSSYSGSHHLSHHRTPSNSILESPHLSHPSVSPHPVAADVSHEPLSPHNLQHYPASTTGVSAAAYTSSLQHPHSPGPVYSQYPYNSPYSPHHAQHSQGHGLHHYGDGGSVPEVDIQVPKEEPYDASHQSTSNRNMTTMGDEYHHNGGWGTGPADESSVRKAYGSSILYSYDDDASHGHAQAHSRSSRLGEEGDPEGNSKDPDEYVIGQVEE